MIIGQFFSTRCILDKELIGSIALRFQKKVFDYLERAEITNRK